MIRKKLRYQLGCFCNASNIRVNPELLQRAVEKFMPQGFFPTSVQEMDGMTMRPVQRLCLQSPARGLQVVCLSGRIDVVKEIGFFDRPDAGDVNEFVGEAQRILGEVLAEFQIKASRLVFIVEYYLKEMSGEEVEAKRRLLEPHSFIAADAENVEWSVRNISRGILRGWTESVNHHTVVSNAKAQLFEAEGTVEYEGLHLLLDVNTVGENTETRFDQTNMEDFYVAALGMHDAMIEHYREVLFGAENVE